MPYRRPPLNGTLIRNTRLRLGLTQDQVQEECARRGQPVFNLSRMENGDIKHPSPRVFPVLADVLGLEISDLLAEEADQADEPHGAVAA